MNRIMIFVKEAAFLTLLFGEAGRVSETSRESDESNGCELSRVLGRVEDEDGMEND
jgi:hypothetical protein